jgi:murein L,D-transpeptidase YcbB/YkuD
VVGLLILHRGQCAAAASIPPGEAAARRQATFAGTQGLQDAVDALRAVAAAGGWPPLAGQRVLRAGERGPEVAALRARLRASGDAPAAPVEEPELFEDGLAAAVRSFQTRHGLAGDGVVGPRTRAELDTTPGERIRQLEINLQRRAALPADLGDRFLLLNLAAFELAVVERGQQVFASRAVVGKPSSPTPVISSLVTAAIFNPVWHVPPGIAQREIGPRAARDPSFLGRQGIRVFGPDGEEVDPARVDWRNRAAVARYSLRQDPGPRSALGRLSFQFPNDRNVCLHDTPQRELFESASRAFSHGCIRIERPLDLAALLFAPELGAAELASLIGAGETVTRSLPVQVPIHVVHWTAFVDAEGRLNFRPDVYGRDR